MPAAPDKHADRDGCQHVLQVVRALQRHLRHRHNFPFAVPISKVNLRSAHQRSFFNLLFPAEPEQLRAATIRQSGRGRIVGIEHGKIIGPLILKDARFSVHVIRKSLVAIEMVGRDVQNHRDPGTKFDDRFQLEARYFQHNPGRGPALIHKTDGRITDIPANQRGELSGSNNLTGQRCRGGLPVGSGNGNDGTRQKLRRKFDFANHRHFQCARLYQLRRIHRHTRTDDDQVLSTKGSVAVSAGFDGNPVL